MKLERVPKELKQHRLSFNIQLASTGGYAPARRFDGIRPGEKTKVTDSAHANRGLAPRRWRSNMAKAKKTAPKLPRNWRTKSKDPQLPGTSIVTDHTFAEMIGKPLQVVKGWQKLPENPLPVIRLPSHIPNRKGQIVHVEVPVAIAWVKSFATNAQANRTRRAR
jgi:hypothetical protein